ncbi:MAG TPA: dodecin domain-containing protein [Thermoanaerobacterales bacterium]|nr:dodecin domain-containing protein [Thermoanaerobacterales bacterium]
MTIKILELVGESNSSWEEAVQQAVLDASKTIENIVGVEVLNNTATVNNDGEITNYRANVNVAFKVDSR